MRVCMSSKLYLLASRSEFEQHLPSPYLLYWKSPLECLCVYTRIDDMGGGGGGGEGDK